MINLSILSFNEIVTNLHKRFRYERQKICFLRKNKKKKKSCKSHVMLALGKTTQKRT